MNIGWLCVSGVTKSETFLVSNLKLLSAMGSVLAVSGASRGEKVVSNHIHTPFAEHPLNLLHTIRRKLTGKNVHRSQLQERCERMTRKLWIDFKPDLFWIDFGTTAIVARRLLLSQNVPFVIAVHGYDISSEFKDDDYRKELALLANSDRCMGIICASQHTKRLCVLGGIMAEKCKIIRYALNGEVMKKDASILKTKVPSFVHFGRLTEKKHPLATFEAFRRVHEQLPNAQMTFIGDGPERVELSRRIEEAKLVGHVHIRGAMDQADALKEVQRHWVFVQHSVTAKTGDQEGFALSPAEAALMEMPVISTLHNGIPEHVIDGETGFLVREFDYDSMADRMLKLARDHELRRKMGKEGRANILEMCDPEVRMYALKEFLSKVQKK